MRNAFIERILHLDDTHFARILHMCYFLRYLESCYLFRDFANDPIRNTLNAFIERILHLKNDTDFAQVVSAYDCSALLKFETFKNSLMKEGFIKRILALNDTNFVRALRATRYNGLIDQFPFFLERMLTLDEENFVHAFENILAYMPNANGQNLFTFLRSLEKMPDAGKNRFLEKLVKCNDKNFWHVTHRSSFMACLLKEIEKNIDIGDILSPLIKRVTLLEAHNLKYQDDFRSEKITALIGHVFGNQCYFKGVFPDARSILDFINAQETTRVKVMLVEHLVSILGRGATFDVTNEQDLAELEKVFKAVEKDTAPLALLAFPQRVEKRYSATKKRLSGIGSNVLEDLTKLLKESRSTIEPLKLEAHEKILSLLTEEIRICKCTNDSVRLRIVLEAALETFPDNLNDDGGHFIASKLWVISSKMLHQAAESSGFLRGLFGGFFNKPESAQNAAAVPSEQATKCLDDEKQDQLPHVERDDGRPPLRTASAASKS